MALDVLAMVIEPKQSGDEAVREDFVWSIQSARLTGATALVLLLILALAGAPREPDPAPTLDRRVVSQVTAGAIRSAAPMIIIVVDLSEPEPESSRTLARD